jgi:hypothetical protein
VTAGTKKKRKRRGGTKRSHHGYYAAAVTAALRQRVHGLTAASYDEMLHPRGRDGKWIEKLGFVKISGFGDDRIDGHQGMVTAIVPNEKTGKADIKVEVFNEDGSRSGTEITLQPDNVEQSTVKGRLNAAEFASEPTLTIAGDREALEAQIPTGANEGDAALLDSLRERVHNWREVEEARRFAETEITIDTPSPDVELRADEQLLQTLRDRVHRLEQSISRRRTMATA